MASHNFDTPDLQTVLATLAQLGPQTTATSTTRQIPIVDASAFPNPTSVPPSSQWSDSVPDAQLGKLNSSSVQERPIIDPASITNWEDGLRCVTKIAAQNARFSTTINKVSLVAKLIATQRHVERKWWNERQELVRAQARRQVSSAKARSILSSLNGLNTPGPNLDQTAADDAEELFAFDLKVWTWQQSVVFDMSAQLKALGVPFFGTESRLVLRDGTDVAQILLPAHHPAWSPLVTESQLGALRSRMAEHLEILYKER